MNTFEPVSLTELKRTDYDSLIRFRIKKILIICSQYDAFILEEDGHIEEQIRDEYMQLGLSNPPHFVWTTSSDNARKKLTEDSEIDMVICMYNTADKGILPLAKEIKEGGSKIPFVLLTHYSKEISRRLSRLDTSNVDYIFTWHGNTDLILAIVKLYEDKMNSENDILNVGVQAILLVEDSVRYYSMYLPELYKLVLTQNKEFLKEALNEQQNRNRRRCRPKIILATNYDDAIESYNIYKKNLLGVISDVGFVKHAGDAPETEVLDAGIDFVKYVRNDDPMMPILLQSSQESLMSVAQELGVGFLKKYSKTLILQLSDYIKSEFCFGDFVFNDESGLEYGRASNLKEMEKLVRIIPDEVYLYHASKNKLSKWFFARGLFSLGRKIRNVNRSTFSTTAEVREYVAQTVHDYHVLNGRGVIARFDPENYERYIWFSRCGEGSLGGKARGLAFLNSMIFKYRLTNKYENTKISIPRTVVIATEYFDQFILENGLQYVIDSDTTDEEVLSEFVSARLPEKLMSELKAYVKTVRSPLAIRSSSKLEDSNYQPFAGVYSTYMIPLVANKDQMLRMLAKAIKSVYASVYFNGSRTYIHTTGNLLSEEKMAVVVQSVCGTERGGYYYPLLSGVARSVNYYPIGKEKLEEGIVNLAFGLGKTVVDGGHSLRFSPKYPKRILQLSDPGLAMRDTQKYMYALDLRPGEFKTSVNDSVNLVHMPVNEALAVCEHAAVAASTFSMENNRMVPGVSVPGARVITFDTVLKYNSFPLAAILQDVMAICKEELMCDVEIEFAADIVEKNGVEQYAFKLLQVRPVSEFSEENESSVEQIRQQSSCVLIESTKALGNGIEDSMKYVIYVDPDKFDSALTKEYTRIISKFNSEIKAEGANYLLLGPGRWGSSDPWLGIPVLWSDISEARLIVETAIPGFRIEPSQGTHFFQNITSLGVGYLTIDTVVGDGNVNTAAFAEMETVKEEGAVKMLRLPAGTVSYIDRKTNCAIVGCQAL